MGRNGKSVEQTSQGGVDAAIAVIAGRQNGNITRGQLVALGMNGGSITHRLAMGRMFRVYRGVYSVGRPAITPVERATAAVLACGAGAALSHGSAMTLWGLAARWDTPFEVIVPGDRRPPGIRVHRSISLAPRDLTRQLGVRVTTPARTLLDVAPALGARALSRAVNEARHTCFLKLAALADLVERAPTHPGAARIRPLLADHGGPTRAGWEDDFPGWCAAFDLPRPVMAAKVLRYEVDALFVAEKVIVELDGWEFHCDRAAFASDRNRDADTLAAGFVTVRITRERIDETAVAEADRLHRILAARRGVTTRHDATARRDVSARRPPS